MAPSGVLSAEPLTPERPMFQRGHLQAVIEEDVIKLDDAEGYTPPILL